MAGLPPGYTGPVTWRLYPGGVLGPPYDDFGPVRALCRTPSGDLWAAAWTPAGSHLLVHREGRWERHAPPPTDMAGRSPFEQTGPLVWYRDRLWAGGRRLAVLDRGRWALVERVPSGPISAFAVDREGALWVGSGQGPWRTADGHAWEWVDLPGRGAWYGVTALCADEASAVWAAQGGRDAGSWAVQRRDPATGIWAMLPMPPRAGAFRDLAALAADAAGRLWVGSANYGAWCWADGTWRRVPGSMPATQWGSGAPAPDVMGLCADRAGRVWVAGFNRLSVHGGGSVERASRWRQALLALEPAPRERRLQVWGWGHGGLGGVLHLDAAGRLWIGTPHGGVGWLDTTREPYPADVPADYY